VNAVLDPHEYAWAPGAAGCRLRREDEPVRGALWHWTAGEGDPEAVVRVLRQRGLSVHYVIGYDGRILRCADPKTTVCYHGGSIANPRFVGIEIASKGLAPASPKRPRAPVTAEAHGRKLAAVDFTSAQYEAILRLADELSDRFAIPRSTAQGSTVLPHVGRFEGHLEHIHVSKRKIDCGGLVMRALREHGYA
jgi:N-acetyl-anhydromuramyl-L-alanine amidase AmpD